MEPNLNTHVLTVKAAEGALTKALNVWAERGLGALVRYAEAFRFPVGTEWSNPILTALDSHVEAEAYLYLVFGFPNTTQSRKHSCLAYYGNDLRVEAGTILAYDIEQEYRNAEVLLSHGKKRKRGVFVGSGGFENPMTIRVPHL